MAYKTIYITNPSYLHTKLSNLVIENSEGNIKLPLEDINSIIIENRQVTLSLPFLSECASNNIAIFSCDEKHMPVGITLPFNNHSKQLLRTNQQIDLSQPFKNQLWREIIKQKIFNQGKALFYLKRSKYEKLINISKSIISGDKNNIEAYASKIYFKDLFLNKFRRFDDDFNNNAMSYGYAILRGSIARALVGYGLIPSLGIHHRNEYNNFNLADDLIEPFRPIVDLFVASQGVLSGDFTIDFKASLIDILSINILMDNKKISVSNCIDEFVKSFVTCINKSSIKYIKLPELIGLTKHRYV